MAVAGRDQATIERLAKASAAGHKPWSERAEQVRGLIAGSRAATPLVTEKYSDDGRQTAESVQTAILAAKATGNVAVLVAAENAVKESTLLAANERDDLLKLLASARSEVPPPSPEMAELLKGLSEESRATQAGTVSIELDSSVQLIAVSKADLILVNDLGGSVKVGAGTVAANGGFGVDVKSPKTSSFTISKIRMVEVPAPEFGKGYTKVTFKTDKKTIAVPKGLGLTGKAPPKVGIK